MTQKTFLPGLLAAFCTTSALAFEPFIVKDIRVEGIQRTEAGTVFSYLPVRVGETMTDEKAAQAIKSLFATGFFKDVRIETDGNIVNVIVEERPSIAQIDFEGLKEFDKDQIVKGLREVGFAVSRAFDRSALDKAEQELKRQYLTRGKYAATVTTTVTPLERNRVAINFKIDEGASAKIKQINIVGAQAFREKTLLDEFQLQTPNWISWYTKNDQYSKQKLSADLESLRSFYLNRGYLEFNVESTQVSTLVCWSAQGLRAVARRAPSASRSAVSVLAQRRFCHAQPAAAHRRRIHPRRVQRFRCAPPRLSR